MRFCCFFFSLFFLQAADAQSLQIFGAGQGQLRSQEPCSWGPSLGLEALDVPRGYAVSLHVAWAKGKLADEQKGYRMHDELFRFGGTVERRICTKGRFDLFAGVLIERFWMERYVSGYTLGWGQIHTGDGAIAGVLGRARFRVGGVTSVVLGVEPVHAFYSTTSDLTALQLLRGRPLANGFYLRGSFGLSFTFLPAD